MLSLLLAITGGVSSAQNGLEGIIVEKYYVSNAADSIGSIGLLPAGSVTYRIFADMLPGYKFQAIYGVSGHPFLLNTSTAFFNNEDRGKTTGSIGSGFINDNSVALDSWFSVGGAAAGNMGILKNEDDGIANLITGNTILMNSDTSAGIALTTQDGIVAGTPVTVTFVGISASDLNVFNTTSNFGNSFSTSNGSIAALGGSVGPIPATNKVLIGQFTTNGIFHFELNIQIGTPGGGTENYVASNPSGAEISIPSLIFTSSPAIPIVTTSTITYCQGDTASILTATANSGCTLNWYTTATGGTADSIAPTPSTSTAGTTTYYVSQENAANKESPRRPINIIVNSLPVPTISANGPTTFCSGDSVVLTSGTVSGNMWSTSDTANSIIVTSAGSYDVMVTDSNGCQGISALTTIIVNPLPAPTISANGPTTFCNGDSVILMSSAASGNIWSTSDTATTITVNTFGNFSVTETDINGCQGTSTPITIIINPLPSSPTISASGPTSFCTGDSVILTSNAASGNMWSTSDTANFITIKNSGTYEVTITDENGCKATSSSTTISVGSSPLPTVSITGATTFCAGDSVMLTSSAADSYSWSNGAVTQSITVYSTANYHVTTTNSNACNGVGQSTDITVTINPLPATPIISSSGPIVFCTGDSVTLTSSASSGNMWTTNDIGNSITAKTSGNYGVTVTDGNGCQASSTLTTVNVNPIPVAMATDSVFGASVIFSNTSTGANAYTWHFGDSDTSSATAPTHTYTGIGNYTVILIASNGSCSDSITLSVNISGVGINEAHHFTGVNIYPNPLSEDATIEINLNESTKISVLVYDITGKIVAHVYEGEINAGITKLELDANALEAGLYYTTIISADIKKTFRMIVVK